MRIGELFSGYGGLGMGVQAVLGGEIAWHSDIDKGACKILAHRYPDVPNLGDITTIDWSQVEPVDVLTGGSPCQDLSHAGKRAGMTDGTRSNLWVAMREAIAQLKPRLVVWENVGGAFSAAADSEVKPCAGCVGDGRGVHLRALGRVLGDLASLGFDADWVALRAADVGAPHGRLRVFVVAYPASDAGRIEHRDGATAAYARGGGRDRRAQAPFGRQVERVVVAGSGALLPSPRTSDTNGAGRHGDGGLDLRTAVSLLPSPHATDYKSGYASDGAARHVDQGQGTLGETVVTHLLPTPMVGSTNPAAHGQISGDYRAKMDEALANWGQYAAAITRWESVTRLAPPPTELGPKGSPRLSAAFSEWMMGLPAGWITDVPGITRNEALKAAGNGVVPQQAAAALRIMLGANVVAA